MGIVRITARKNGAFRVEAPAGAVELVDAEGNSFNLEGKTAFSLCRCGASAAKPFCDGSHKRIEFHAEELAIAHQKESE